MYSQMSGVKSGELVVERSLKLDALNLNWLGVSDLNARYKGGYVEFNILKVFG